MQPHKCQCQNVVLKPSLRVTFSCLNAIEDSVGSTAVPEEHVSFISYASSHPCKAVQDSFRHLKLH